jgi:hypothetical protein
MVYGKVDGLQVLWFLLFLVAILSGCPESLALL